MHDYLRLLRVVAPVGLVAAVGAAGLSARVRPAHAAAPAHPVRIARQASCAATGTYFVGPRVLPMDVQPPRSEPRGRGIAPKTYPALTYVLRGTITVTSYGGCGQPTAGSFNIRREPVGPIVRPQSQGMATGVCPTLCVQPATGLAGATGTFARDPLHAGDPTYVIVTATITSARPGPQQGRPCSTQSGCPLPNVITSTVAMTNVTGYLQIASGRAVALSFLPPPTNGQAPSAVVLNGYRGGGGPLTP